MTDRDERRSRVPAGTFGSSEPPATSIPPGPVTEEPVSARKRFSRTLSGDEPAAELEDEGQSVAERHKPQGNTLLGHPPTPGPTVPGQPGPVLSPPKWRGAGAYRAGEEPQPHVSLIPVPPPMAAGAGKPVGVPIGVMRSSVKTKMGQPPPPVRPQPAPGPGAPASDPPTPGDDTLKDTIQQMLEQQASVPIQVEEGIPELPMDELLEEEAAGTNSSPAEEDDTQRPPPDLAQAPDSVEVAPPAQGESELPEAPAEAPAPPASSATAERAPTLSEAVPPVELAKPAPAAERRRVERRPPESAGAAEARSAFFSRWDSEGTRGVLFVAAMVLVGGGGWLLTRGNYHPRLVVRPPAPVVAPEEPAATAEPKKPAEAAPPASTSEGPSKAPAPATTAAAASKDTSKDTSAQRAARKTRAPSEGEAPEPDNEPSAEPSPRAEPTGVLTVTPRAEEAGADLPDSPTRDNVIATLNALRPAFLECAQGQRGVAQLDITVVDSGAVSHVVVGGDFAGSTQGSCIARAARNAQFAPFKKPRFRLVYPISL